MRWTICSGDILDIPADILICSANGFLNLSGGVGGALLLRYGPSMQQFLHDHLAGTGSRSLRPGQIVTAPACGTPYKAVIHAVAVDAFYECSIETVRQTVVSALEEAAAIGGPKVALAALATGYGRLSINDFGSAVAPLVPRQWHGISDVTICLRHEEEASVLRSVLQA